MICVVLAIGWLSAGLLVASLEVACLPEKMEKRTLDVEAPLMLSLFRGAFVCMMSWALKAALRVVAALCRRRVLRRCRTGCQQQCLGGPQVRRRRTRASRGQP